MLDDLKDRTRLSTPQELFVHTLGSCLTMESQVGEWLGTLADRAHDVDLKRALRQHGEETESQLRNLRRAFETLGKNVVTAPCPAIEGIERGCELNLRRAAEALEDVIIVAGCVETEQHEIAVYENLIAQARALGQDDVVALLRRNLEQERAALDAFCAGCPGRARRGSGPA